MVESKILLKDSTDINVANHNFLMEAHPIFFIKYFMLDFFQFTQHDIMELVYYYLNF